MLIHDSCIGPAVLGHRRNGGTKKEGRNPVCSKEPTFVVSKQPSGATASAITQSHFENRTAAASVQGSTAI